MIPVSDILICFLAYWLLLISAFVCGKMINGSFLKLPGKTSFFHIFSHTLYGSIALVSVYSIVLTNGKTISWLYILLFVLLRCFRRHEPFSTSDTQRCLSWKEYVFFASGLVLVFCLLAVDFVNFKQLVFVHIDPDLLVYSKLINNLNAGMESSNSYQSYISEAYFTPYHYYDLWIGALINKLTGVNKYTVFALVVTPFLGSILYCALVATCEVIGIRRWWVLLLCVFLIVPEVWTNSPLVLAFFPRLSYSLYPYMKWMIAGIVTILFLLNIQYFSLRFALFSLLLLSVQYFLAFPGIAGGVGLFILYKIYTTKQLEWKRAFIAYLLFVCCYAIYLKTTNGMSQGKFDVVSVMQLLPNVVGRFAKISVIAVVCCFPGVFLLWMNREKRTVKDVVILFVVISLCVNGATALVSYVNDSLQIQTIILSGFVGVGLVFQLFFIYKLKHSRILLVICLLLAFYGPYKWLTASGRRNGRTDILYLKQAIEHLTSCTVNDYLPVAVLKSEKHLNSIYDGGEAFRFPGEELNTYLSKMLPFSLSALDAIDAPFYTLETNRAKKSYYLDWIARALFYQYVMDADSSLPLWQHQMQFMKKMEIHYLLAEKDVIIDENLVNHLSLMFRNKKTGERLYRVH